MKEYKQLGSYGLIRQDKKILLIKKVSGPFDGKLDLPGGTIEFGETPEDALKREVLEETGIELDNKEIGDPFMKVKFLNKDYPEVGKNRKAEIYYYAIKTNKKPNLTKVKYTKNEIANNFKIAEIPLNLAITKIKENIPNNEKNQVIAPDMILAIEEYLKLTQNN